MTDGMNAAMYRPTKIIFITKILSSRLLLIFRDVHGMAHQFIHPLIFCCRDWNHWNSKHFFHVIYINRTAISRHLVHHVKRHNSRYVHLQQLHRKIKISLDICRVHNIDDCLWMFL